MYSPEHRCTTNLRGQGTLFPVRFPGLRLEDKDTTGLEGLVHFVKERLHALVTPVEVYPLDGAEACHDVVFISNARGPQRVVHGIERNLC